MRAQHGNGRARRAVGLLAAGATVAVSAVAACALAPPGGPTSSPQPPLGCPPVALFSGVKVVTETLAPNPGADPAAPVALAAGQCATFYVQWNTTTGATLSRFSTSGTEAAADPAYAVGGRAGRSLAVPVCTNSNSHAQDCPLLAVDKSGPDINIRDCLHGTFDFSPGSSLGMVINGGGRRAFIAERFAPGGTTTPALGVTPIRDSTCSYLYDEGSLYANPNDKLLDGYSKGRIVALPGVASGFTVGAAARLGSDGMVVAGIGGVTGPAWAVSLDASLAPLHQGTFTVGGNLSAVVTSAAVDSAGNVFVCGTSRSRLLLPQPSPGHQLGPQPLQIPVTTQGWVAQGTPDLTSWAVLTMPVTVDGCALAPSGKLIVSGTYSGTYQGQTSQGTDIFLALVTPGTGGSAPALASFARHGTSQNEPMVSAPYVAFGNVFLAGVTQGDWGAAVGVGQNKVFLARFDPATLALF